MSRWCGCTLSTLLDLQAENLDDCEGGEVWSAPDYALVLLMDHDPLGLAGMAEIADAEPVKYLRPCTGRIPSRSLPIHSPDPLDFLQKRSRIREDWGTWRGWELFQ